MSGYINNNSNTNTNTNTIADANAAAAANVNANSNANANRNKSRLPEQSGLYGIVSSTIGITEYIAFFIINKITSILGIDTSGKDLNNLLDEIYKVLEDPVTRQKFLLVMGSIAEILVILVDELSGPLKEATLQFIDLGHEATVKLAKSFVSASVDALGTVPIAGELVEGIKLFDDITKQIQSSIGVFLKTFTLITNLLGANLDRFDNIKTRIEGSVDKIKSQLQGINLNIPSMASMASLSSLSSLDNLQDNINTGISNFANSSLKGVHDKINKGVQDKLNTGITNSTPSYNPKSENTSTPLYPPTEYKGGTKHITKNINKTAKKIVKNLEMFYNRKYKPNTTRRHHKHK